MTKSLPFSVHWLKLCLVSGGLLLVGCFSSDFSPSYKEADIPGAIKKICLEEHKLNVLPTRVGDTLWIYAPQQRLLHAEFGKNPEKVFDEELLDKARNILTSISRVLISSDKAPEFFVLVLSDINIGLDYSLTVNILDIKKSASGGIPWNEANKRYVLGFEQAGKAIGDTSGKHLKLYDIKLPEFLSRQIVQRVRILFQEEPIKNYFSLKDVSAGFQNKIFTLEYSMVKKAEPPQKPNISKDIFHSIVYCFKSYDFKDFSQVEIKDLLGDGSAVYESKDILTRSIE
jgi:hypothetical protein